MARIEIVLKLIFELAGPREDRDRIVADVGIALFQIRAQLGAVGPEKRVGFYLVANRGRHGELSGGASLDAPLVFGFQRLDNSGALY